MSNEAETVTRTGLATARGFAVGPVYVYRGDGDLVLPEYAIEPGCVGDELMRIRRAHVETQRDLENLIAVLRKRTGRDDVKVFECHLMILEDPTLVKETADYIRNDLVNAESAVRRTANRARAQFARMNDPYFRERVRDLDDIERRLLKVLTGFRGETIELHAPSIIVADDLTPSETMRLPRELVLGFATNGGSTTSHVALLARAMSIPAVAGLGDITSRVKPGETILLDGTAGTVTLRPTAAMIRDYGDLLERQRELSEDAAHGPPAGTLKAGGDVPIYANVHPGVPLSGLQEYGARGIGLYRSEYLWLNRELEPTEEEQFAAYREAARFVGQLGDAASLTIRTLDIGGDKTVRGITAKEANPFLGNRSIRYMLANPSVFKTQFRAILRASAFGRVKILLPMVSCVEELKASAALLAEAREELDREGLAYAENVPLGAMIEVPSAALNAETLATGVDFFSIGTNDLVQYTMAADRGNKSVAHLYQPLNPAVLKLMRLTIGAARRRGIPVSVCGESASDPVEGIVWAAMGVDTLSMSVTYIPVMAKILSRLTRDDLEAFRGTIEAIDPALPAADAKRLCHDWLSEHVFDFDRINI